MQSPAVLIDFVSAWDIAIFLSVPLLLLIAVFFEEHFGGEPRRAPIARPRR